jgi:hypothetical protein
VTLQPRGEDLACFEFRVPSTSAVTISGNFDCWEEGNTFVRACRNVQAWIETVSNLSEMELKEHYPWRSTPGVSEEIFHFQVEGLPNKYRLCFESSGVEEEEEEEVDDTSLANILQLGFHLRVQSAAPRALSNEELGPDAQRALHLLEEATMIRQHWHNLRDHFDFFRNREAVQQKLLQQTYVKVMGWSIVEAILVITMAIAQVCYWKAFFEQRRYL